MSCTIPGCKRQPEERPDGKYFAKCDLHKLQDAQRKRAKRKIASSASSSSQAVKSLPIEPTVPSSSACDTNHTSKRPRLTIDTNTLSLLSVCEQKVLRDELNTMLYVSDVKSQRYGMQKYITSDWVMCSQLRQYISKEGLYEFFNMFGSKLPVRFETMQEFVVDTTCWCDNPICIAYCNTYAHNSYRIFDKIEGSSDMSIYDKHTVRTELNTLLLKYDFECFEKWIVSEYGNCACLRRHIENHKPFESFVASLGKLPFRLNMLHEFYEGDECWCDAKGCVTNLIE